jgi:hypothetical protein
MITFKEKKLHWNYFIALEQDLEKTSRYIEFCNANREVFSIELAHLLFAAASEVDVLAKCICKLIEPKASPRNIDEYKKIITNAAKIPTRDAAYIPDITIMETSIPR